MEDLTYEKLDRMVELHKTIKILTEEYDKLKELIIAEWLGRGATGVFTCAEGVISVKERYTPQYDFNKVTDLCGGDKDKLIAVMALSNTKLKKLFNEEELKTCESGGKLSYVVSIGQAVQL